MSLAQQRCYHHGQREAIARCLECREFYCRECITEHDHRFICAACLKKLSATPVRERRGLSLAGLARAVQLGFGLALAAFFFYCVGQALLGLPGAFHDGTVWQLPWLEEGP
jgi:hypothetical protein